MEHKENVWNDENLIQMLKTGGVVVMPTDTLYGIVGRAEDETVINKIYNIRKRAPEKPLIILISDFSQLSKFSIFPTAAQKEFLNNLENTPTSVIFDCRNEKFAYLHRGTQTLAFRVPVSAELCELLAITGPLVAPSANPEGEVPAENIREAENYFGDSVDLYVDGGEISGNASRIIRLNGDGTTITLRG